MSHQCFVFYKKNIQESLLKEIIERACDSRFTGILSENNSPIPVFSGKALPDSMEKLFKKNQLHLLNRVIGLTADEWALFSDSVIGGRYLSWCSHGHNWLQSLDKRKYYGKNSFVEFEKDHVMNKYIDIMDENKLIIPETCSGRN